MAADLPEDGDVARAGGEIGERTTTKPTINQPQPAQNIAGSSGTWPKYQTVNCKEYAITNPRSKDQAIAFFCPIGKDFSNKNMKL